MLPLHLVQFELDREFTKNELDTVAYHKNYVYHNAGNATSNNTKLLDTEFPELREMFQKSIDEYVDKIIVPESENFKLKITQSWLNYTEPGQFHHPHTHPNSIISGVFYFNSNEDEDKILFYAYNENPQIIIKSKLSGASPLNSLSWWFPAKPKSLILFPSSMKHSVPHTTSDKTRISLSFNTFSVGDLGALQDLTHVNISC